MAAVGVRDLGGRRGADAAPPRGGSGRSCAGRRRIGSWRSPGWRARSSCRSSARPSCSRNGTDRASGTSRLPPSCARTPRPTTSSWPATRPASIRSPATRASPRRSTRSTSSSRWSTPMTSSGSWSCGRDRRDRSAQPVGRRRGHRQRGQPSVVPARRAGVRGRRREGLPCRALSGCAPGRRLALGVLVRVAPILGAPGGRRRRPVPGDDRRHPRRGHDRARDDLVQRPRDPVRLPAARALVAAAVGEVTGAPTLDAAALDAVPRLDRRLVAFAWLAWRVLPPVAAVGATLAYALMPHAYDWVIAGGGLTRGRGCSSPVAWPSRPSASRRRCARRCWPGSLLGCRALSHPQAAVFGAIGCLVLSWSAPMATVAEECRHRRGGAVVVVLPWLVGVIGTHGFEALAGPATASSR